MKINLASDSNMKQSFPASARKVQLSLSALALAALVACGGGGSSTTTQQLNGVAAYGAPMAGATITLTDANGASRTTTTATDGSYTLDVTGLAAPFLLKATSTLGDTVKEYSALIASAPQAGQTVTANVTPLTHALVTLTSSDGASPNEFTDVSKLKNLDVNKLKTALSNLQTVLKDVLSDAGLSASFDPLTVKFKADRSSPEDTLLDTIKVSVSDQGVALTNARVPVSDNSDATEVATVTLKGTTEQSPPSLAKPTVNATNLKGLDAFMNELNACLALPPAERVSKDSAGAYTLQGACNNITGFDAANYKANGYSLQELWGLRFLEQIPANSRLSTPEFLLFLDDGNRALVRLATTSANGGRLYTETAAKTASGWRIVGNQRNYDASISPRFYRGNDLSTNGWTLPATLTNSPDAGKNVGKLDVYASRLTLFFNQSGPNGSNVYAVRIKGPGLPTNGVVLARSSSCGTNDYLAFYSNNGNLPAASTTAMPTTATANSWVLDAKNFGTNYTGSDFYNQYRGMTSTGSASTSTSNNVAPQPVDMKSIPEFALYSWEVFTTDGGSIPAATFTSRLVTRPLAASEGNKLPWSTLNQDALDYINPANTDTSGELSNATFSWTLAKKSTPAVTGAFLYGSSTSGRMNMNQSVAKLGDTSISLSAAAEANGNGKACTTTKIPALFATSGYREVGTRQTTDRGLTLQQYSFHTGRAAASTTGSSGATSAP